MKIKKRLIAMAVAMLLVTGVCAGFAQNAAAANAPGEVIYIDPANEKVPLAATPTASTVLTPTAPGTKVSKNQKAVIDYSNTGDGYIMIKYLQPTTKQLRVLVKGPSGTQYQYSLNQNGDYDVFPLSDGNGNYTVGVYEQIEGSKFSTSNSTTISVTLTDQFAPFLRPNQFVNFNSNSAVVAKAAELVKGKTTLTDKVSSVYNYLISNFTYDRQLAADVKPGYVPDVDSVLEKKKGICFDYAAVMAAMLRSQGIPTRLVIGYAGEAYHAWIDVYSSETGWINNVIYFDGKDWKLMDPTFASTSKQSAEFLKLVGDGTSYKARFLY